MVDLDKNAPGVTINAQFESLNKDIASEPDNPVPYFRRSKIFLERQELNNALLDISSAINLDSTKSEYYFQMAKIYRKMNKFMDGLAAIYKADKLNCPDPELFLLGGEMYFILKEYKKSMVYLNKTLYLNKFESRAHFYISLNYLETGDTLSAIHSLETAVTQNTDYAEGYDQLAVIHDSKKDYKSALEYATSAISSKKDAPALYYNRGTIFFHTGNYDKSIEDFQQAITLDSLHYLAWYNLGTSYYNKKNYQSAGKCFQKVIDTKPEYQPVYFIFGQTLEWLNNDSLAAVQYAKAIELDNKDEKSVKALKKIENRK
ncbi:MAG: hypothetical protein A3H98_03055 [Bacteroidetes bacterium RIFCSPLOWO2_02_FULL_36_8]|nr:MAG: hypothetical protein A3H98_03055 [Bacteroidetes bacterium RIFCSPLOWO2_02_FULL_36_8]OFY70337.1 MAG: hypothetical protein A3G23_09390 [Bacteroidetes bacterium RIFCSPLOWO2_12_FULL_37_12]